MNINVLRTLELMFCKHYRFIRTIQNYFFSSKYLSVEFHRNSPLNLQKTFTLVGDLNPSKVLKNETFEFLTSRLGQPKEVTLFFIKVN